MPHQEMLSQRAGQAAVQSGDVRRDAMRLDNATDTLTPKSEREMFLPLTRNALLDRLTREGAWPNGDAGAARRFLLFLDNWRRQTYVSRLRDLEQDYEPFSPDSDLRVTRTFTADERRAMQRRVVDSVAKLLRQANYSRVDASDLQIIMTDESHYGLDLQVDLNAFEELQIYYRGKDKNVETRRNAKRLYLMKEEFPVDIFRRLVIVFKLKPIDVRTREVMKEEAIDQFAAERKVLRNRAHLPPQITSDNIYIKVFKNIPQADLEMIFPNTKIKFRMFDKIKLGATAGGGLGAGAVGAAGKIALLTTNPIAAAGAAIGLGGVAFRQVMNVIAQKNKYMIKMAQNLYFHALADNRGAMTLLADAAAEQDVKEEMLLYSVLAKEQVTRDEIQEVDRAIETYLHNTFGIDVDFDVQDALERLIADGVVVEAPGGVLKTLSPRDAAARIDLLWDKYLDELPDPVASEGREFDSAREREENRA